MMAPKRVGMIGFDQVTALHLVGPADAFSAATLDDGYGGRIPCYEVCTIGTVEHFRGESGLTFTADCTLQNAPELDTIIVAGGRGIRRPEISGAITHFLLERAGWHGRIGSVCSGIYGLAPTGLLDGREVTTHWRYARDVAQRFPMLKVNHKRPLVQDGRFYTSTGLSAGLSLSLAMIQEDYGPYVATSVGRDLLLYPVQQDRQDLPPEPAQFESYRTDRFADLVAWIVRNLQGDLSVEIMARKACMSPENFSKAFKSFFGVPPTDFVENLRLNEARRRLSKRQKTVQSVAASVGFRNSGAFQRAFERKFGWRPSRVLAESNGVRKPQLPRIGPESSGLELTNVPAINAMAH
jgi:transcriptional regulator GlxA family with amidase domain